MKPSRKTARNPVRTLRRSVRDARMPFPRGVWIAGWLAGLLLIATIAWSIQRHDALVTWRDSLAEEGTQVSWPAWNPSWPDLPRPPRNVRASDLRGPYAFAALNADRLRFIPCYCGCAREGHRSALECFVSGFTPQGAPIWTDHAFTCPLCVNILREVSLMTSRGMPLRTIRATIDEHHSSPLATSTATPLPQ